MWDWQTPELMQERPALWKKTKFQSSVVQKSFSGSPCICDVLLQESLLFLCLQFLHPQPSCHLLHVYWIESPQTESWWREKLLYVLFSDEGRQFYGWFLGLFQTADSAETHFAQYGNTTLHDRHSQPGHSHLVSVSGATPTKTLHRTLTLRPFRTAVLTDSEVWGCEKFLLLRKSKRGSTIRILNLEHQHSKQLRNLSLRSISAWLDAKLNLLVTKSNMRDSGIYFLVLPTTFSSGPHLKLSTGCFTFCSRHNSLLFSLSLWIPYGAVRLP